MNAHVHDHFAGILAAASGSSMPPAQQLRAELNRAEARIDALKDRIRKLVPTVELDRNATNDPRNENLYVVPDFIVEEAVSMLVDESLERLDELCLELCKREDSAAWDHAADMTEARRRGE